MGLKFKRIKKIAFLSNSEKIIVIKTKGGKMMIKSYPVAREDPLELPQHLKV